MKGDRRLAQLEAWLSNFDGMAGADVRPASADASFRRYFRVRAGNRSVIAMDAPPAEEDCERFVRVASYLEKVQVNSPRVLQADFDQGFLLLTDLGSTQYLEALDKDPGRAETLYGDALAALLRLQDLGREFQSALPRYDDELLAFELSLFRDWLCGCHLRMGFSRGDEKAWRAVSDWLVESALEQPRVFVHRDYHSRNLMVTEADNPGILDFQDAVEGPVTYDLVSLLKDCYIRWPADAVREWALSFHASAVRRGLVASSAEEFLRDFELMGVQRHLKAAGIFARLDIRDGKPAYLQDVPRTLGYISEIAPRYPELAFLGRLIDERCLPALKERAVRRPRSRS